MKKIAIPLAAVLVALACSTVPAVAAERAPGFTIASNSVPTVFSAEYDGSKTPDQVLVTVTNAGSVPTDGSTISIIDTLPAALKATAIHGIVQSLNAELSCTVASATCTFGEHGEKLLPGESLLMSVTVTVAPGANGSGTNTARVQGGGAPTALTSAPVRFGSAAEAQTEPFGIESFAFGVTGANGLTDTQAGAHPFENTVSFALNSAATGSGYPAAAGKTGADGGPEKDFVVDLPPGFLGDPLAIERCPKYKVPAKECPAASQIGVIKLTTEELANNNGEPSKVEPKLNGGPVYVVPVYNVVPDKGYPAEFEFVAQTSFVVAMYATVSPDTNYAVRVIVPDIPAFGNAIAASVTFFGTPLTDPDYENHNPGLSLGGTPISFLENPTGCTTEPQEASLSADSWQHPGALLADGAPDLGGGGWVTRSTTIYPEVTGCELLQFSPSLSVLPESSRADEPSGVGVDLHVPQAPLMEGALGAPALKDSIVTLPSGMSVSPGAATGLSGCTQEHVELLSSAPGSCPLSSELGTAKVTTPLLGEPLEGRVFLAAPECDPCSTSDAADGRMFKLFLEVAGSGVVIKKEGTVDANPLTGQLTTSFVDTPQAPVSDIELRLKGGQRAALSTPQSCGSFVSTSDLTPWSTPITPDATPTSVFNVDWDGNGGACPGSMPFAPSFSAGTSNPNGGQFSPLTVTFSRQDREQDLADIQVRTPPGLVGSLAGIPLCGEPQADLGTCPAGSRIGSMTVAAGAGPEPFYEQGTVYLTGPYRGAPFGLSIVVPTVAGPFNLGNVVVRAQVDVDPSTAALTVTSAPFPQIIDGIPLRLRLANVTIDRPGFIFNPTDCAQQQIEATITGSQGAQTRACAVRGGRLCGVAVRSEVLGLDIG